MNYKSSKALHFILLFYALVVGLKLFSLLDLQANTAERLPSSVNFNPVTLEGARTILSCKCRYVMTVLCNEMRDCNWKGVLDHDHFCFTWGHAMLSPKGSSWLKPFLSYNASSLSKVRHLILVFSAFIGGLTVCTLFDLQENTAEGVHARVHCTLVSLNGWRT